MPETDPSPESECRQLLARLELISHAGTINTDQNVSHGKTTGGGRPSGGIDVKDDLETTLKSHVYYRRRFVRCHTEGQYERLVEEMHDTLDAWMRTPPPMGGALPPVPGSFAWKRMIANDDTTSLQKLKELHMISERTIRRYRERYRTARKAA